VFNFAAFERKQTFVLVRGHWSLCVARAEQTGLRCPRAAARRTVVLSPYVASEKKRTYATSYCVCQGRTDWH